MFHVLPHSYGPSMPPSTCSAFAINPTVSTVYTKWQRRQVNRRPAKRARMAGKVALDYGPSNAPCPRLRLHPACGFAYQKKQPVCRVVELGRIPRQSCCDLIACGPALSHLGARHTTNTAAVNRQVRDWGGSPRALPALGNALYGVAWGGVQMQEMF